MRTCVSLAAVCLVASASWGGEGFAQFRGKFPVLKAPQALSSVKRQRLPAKDVVAWVLTPASKQPGALGARFNASTRASTQAALARPGQAPFEDEEGLEALAVGRLVNGSDDVLLLELRSAFRMGETRTLWALRYGSNGQWLDATVLAQSEGGERGTQQEQVTLDDAVGFTVTATREANGGGDCPVLGAVAVVERRRGRLAGDAGVAFEPWVGPAVGRYVDPAGVAVLVGVDGGVCVRPDVNGSFTSAPLTRDGGVALPGVVAPCLLAFEDGGSVVRCGGRTFQRER